MEIHPHKAALRHYHMIVPSFSQTKNSLHQVNLRILNTNTARRLPYTGMELFLVSCLSDETMLSHLS